MQQVRILNLLSLGVTQGQAATACGLTAEAAEAQLRALSDSLGFGKVKTARLVDYAIRVGWISYTQRRRRIELDTYERKLIHLVRRGLTNDEIGKIWGVSGRRVGMRLSDLYVKLNARNRCQMVRRVYEYGLVRQST